MTQEKALQILASCGYRARPADNDIAVLERWYDRTDGQEHSVWITLRVDEIIDWLKY